MSRSKFQKIYVLLGVLLLCCVMTWMISRHEEKKEQIKNSDEIILTLDADSVTALSWNYEDASFSFHKDEKWLYDEDEDFPVDAEKIEVLLKDFQEFGVSFIIEEVEDYAQYGLEDPLCTIKITTEEQEYEILLGDYSTMDEKRYVSIGDGNVYLAAEDPFEEYETEISKLIRNDVIPELSEAVSIQFTGKENYTIIYEENSSDTYYAEDVYFTDHRPLDTTNVTEYLDTISKLTLSEYVSYNVTEEELQQYGLDDPELEVTVEYPVEEDEETVTETFSFCIGRNQEELQAAQESDEEDAEEQVTSYIRIGKSQIIYEITASNYINLVKVSYDDLRHKKVFNASFNDIYQIDITLEDMQYELVSEVVDEETVWYYQEEEIELGSFRSAVRAMEADSFTEEEPTQKKEIEITFHLENENYPEIRITLYRYDGEHCLAVIDGESVSLIPREEVVEVIEVINSIVLK